MGGEWQWRVARDVSSSPNLRMRQGREERRDRAVSGSLLAGGRLAALARRQGGGMGFGGERCPLRWRFGRGRILAEALAKRCRRQLRSWEGRGVAKPLLIPRFLLPLGFDGGILLSFLGRKRRTHSFLGGKIEQ